MHKCGSCTMCINCAHMHIGLFSSFAYMHMHIAYDDSLKSFSIKSCFSLFTDLQNDMTVSFTTLQDIAKFVKFRKVFSLSGSHFSLVLHRSLFASYVFMFQFWFVVSSSDVEPGGFHRYSLYVCLYVCNIRPALTTPTNLLKFGMKVGDH